MPRSHTVQKGEGVSSIAFATGRFPDKIWADPANAELRRLRGDMNMLVPGDVVVVHDLTAKVETAPTGKSTRFVLRTTPAVLRLQVAVGTKILANQTYTLIVDGVPRNGKTDGTGVLVETVSPTANKAILQMDGLPEQFEILIGRIQPVDTLHGVKARLSNMGFGCGAIDGSFDDATRAAIVAFQERTGLAPNGDWHDAEMQRMLKKLHDSSDELPPEPSPASESASPNQNADS
jgi:Putative peptidoglycan binding domain